MYRWTYTLPSLCSSLRFAVSVLVTLYTSRGIASLNYTPLHSTQTALEEDNAGTNGEEEVAGRPTATAEDKEAELAPLPDKKGADEKSEEEPHAAAEVEQEHARDVEEEPHSPILTLPSLRPPSHTCILLSSGPTSPASTPLGSTTYSFTPFQTTPIHCTPPRYKQTSDRGTKEQRDR